MVLIVGRPTLVWAWVHVGTKLDANPFSTTSPSLISYGLIQSLFELGVLILWVIENHL